jgi:hypothetical protein
VVLKIYSTVATKVADWRPFLYSFGQMSRAAFRASQVVFRQLIAAATDHHGSPSALVRTFPVVGLFFWIRDPDTLRKMALKEFGLSDESASVSEKSGATGATGYATPRS